MPANAFLYCVWRFIFSPKEGIDSRLETKTCAGQINFPTLELWVSAHPSPHGSARFLSEKPLQSHLPRLWAPHTQRVHVFESISQLRSLRILPGLSVRLGVSRNFMFLLVNIDSRTAWHGSYLFPVQVGGAGHGPHSALSELKYQWVCDTGNSSPVCHQKFTTTRWQPGSQVENTDF